MQDIRILVLGPDQGLSSADQGKGAQSAAPAGISVVVEHFAHDDILDMERKFASCQNRIAGVVGTTNVPQSCRLGEIAGEAGVLCFVANNNPVVWANRRNVFHIGQPTPQTTAAVADALSALPAIGRVLLLHDRTEFQHRVATNMESALTAHGKAVKSVAHEPGASLAVLDAWRPDVVYVVFSSETKALPIVADIRRHLSATPILFGRSLLRETFLKSLTDQPGELWFVDNVFRIPALRGAPQQRFMDVMSAAGVSHPTTNHAFGWDGMSFCATALAAADGDPARAIDWLEQGVTLEDASGPCSFAPENHNGRLGRGPTILTRWDGNRFEQV